MNNDACSRATCPHRIEPEPLPLQKNALRIEVFTPATRCLLKLPEHWSKGAKHPGALRWIGSGGSALVFGTCDANCPRSRDL